MLIIAKTGLLIIISFAIGFFFGAAWIGLAKNKKEIESDTFDESEIYNPKLKIIKGEKIRR